VSNKKRLKVTPKNADHDEFSVRRESCMHLSQAHDWSDHTDGSLLAKNVQTDDDDDDDDDDCCKGYRDGSSSCVQKMLRQIIIIMLAKSNDKTDRACLQRRMQQQMSG
jgi:hypothetical protein